MWRHHGRWDVVLHHLHDRVPVHGFTVFAKPINVNWLHFTCGSTNKTITQFLGPGKMDTLKGRYTLWKCFSLMTTSEF